MLDSIWQLLANYGLDTGEIADGISSLFTVIIGLLQLIGLDNLANDLANRVVMPIEE